MNGSLRIGRLQATCHVADERCAPSVRDRALRACRDHVPVALQGAARWFDGGDESVWVVRRIDLSIVTRTEAAPDEIALSIAGSLGRALAKTLTGDGDGANAIRFRTRAAYLSRFIADLAAGNAWARWYFAPMSGWRVLPASAAIRSAIVENPVAGLEALRALDYREIEDVLECLAPTDEALVLNAIAGVSGDAAGSREMTAQDRDARPTTTALRGRRLMAFLRPADPVLNAKVDATSSPSADVVRTDFGGLALLLRDIDDLPWAAWTSGWPRVAADVSPGTCLKWLTLGACVGRARSDAFLADQVWRDLLAIPRTLVRSDIGRWLREVRQDRRRHLSLSAGVDGSSKLETRWLTMPGQTGISGPWCAVLAGLARLAYRRFSRRLPGFANSSVDHLWRNFLSTDAIVEREQDRVVVRCGRPPLHLLLALTGMTRGLAAGTDAGGRPILVFSRD